MKCVRWSVSLLDEETRMRERGRIRRGSQRGKNDRRVNSKGGKENRDKVG